MAKRQYHGANNYVEGPNNNMAGPMSCEQLNDEMADQAKTPAEEDTESTPFPIVLTTYEMIIKNRVHLAHYNWGYIVVDEGHHLKNLDCKLMKEIKKYNSAGRMILTGTPLHVKFFFLWIFRS
jgi:ATP-dependent DNA helicase